MAHYIDKLPGKNYIELQEKGVAPILKKALKNGKQPIGLLNMDELLMD